MRKATDITPPSTQTKSKERTAEIVWLDNQDLLLRYHLSASTLRRWRKQKVLPYYKIGMKIYYIEDEVIEAIRKYRNPENL
jgi:hypothetical protein